MMNRKLAHYILAAVALLCLSCTKEIEQLNGTKEITFRVSLDNSLPNRVKSKATTRAIAADLNATGMLLNGFYSATSLNLGNFTSNAMLMFSKLEIDGNGSYSGNRYFWASSSNYYHFWGYNNIESTTEDGQLCGVMDDDPTTNGGTITFVQPNDPQKMYDLALATPVWNKQSSEGIMQDVELVFKHALSKINFTVYNPNMTQLNNCKLYVTFAGNTFKRKANFTLYDEKMVIDDVLFHGGTHLVAPAFDVPSTATKIDNASFAGDLILLPQDMPYGTITLKMVYTIDGTTEEKIAEAPIPSGSLLKGYACTYALQIDAKAVSMKVTGLQLLPWDVVYSVDIPMFDY